MSWKNILEDPKQYMIYLEGRILQGSKEADEKYLKKLFKYRMGRELDLDHPQALNDKLQWLKINDFKPIIQSLPINMRCANTLRRKWEKSTLCHY